MNEWMVYHETQTFQSLRRTGIHNKKPKYIKLTGNEELTNQLE